jgi:hypothetical protein
MILTSVNLSDHTAYSRTVISQKHKQIFYNKSFLGKLVHDLHMR